MRGRALSPAAQSRVLAAAQDQLLIGGQARAWWAARLDALDANQFHEGVTYDFDFLGPRTALLALHQKLGGKLAVPTMDDATPQSGKLSFEDFEGDGPLEIDFLASMAGGEEAKAKKRAVTVETPQGSFHILHPFDVLRTRIINLHALPSRGRNPRYIAQARLAVQVMRRYLEGATAEAEPRVLLKMIEAVITFATSREGLAAFRKQGIDVLDAIPASEVKDASFHAKRWPQAQAWVAAQRTKGVRRK